MNMIFLLHTQDSNSHMSPERESRDGGVVDGDRRQQPSHANRRAFGDESRQLTRLPETGKLSDRCEVLRQSFDVNSPQCRRHHSRASLHNLRTFIRRLKTKKIPRSSRASELGYEEVELRNWMMFKMMLEQFFLQSVGLSRWEWFGSDENTSFAVFAIAAKRK